MNNDITPHYNSRWPELLSHLTDILKTSLDQHQPAASNDQLAVNLVRALAKNVGGMQFYLPKGVALERALRDAEIYQLHCKHVPIETLAARYNLSMKQIWEIVARQTEQYIQAVQPSLL